MGIGGPAEIVNLFITVSERDRFAAHRRDDVELVDTTVFGIGVFAVSRFSGRIFSLRQESDPSSVGRPLRITVVAGLSQLDQGRPVIAIKPEVMTENTSVPIGTSGANSHRMAVRRDLHRVEIDGIEELVESDGRLLSVRDD